MITGYSFDLIVSIERRQDCRVEYWPRYHTEAALFTNFRKSPAMIVRRIFKYRLICAHKIPLHIDVWIETEFYWNDYLQRESAVEQIDIKCIAGLDALQVTSDTRKAIR